MKEIGSEFWFDAIISETFNCPQETLVLSGRTAIDIIIKVFYLEDFSIMILLSRFCVEFLLKIAMMLVFQNGIWLSHYVPLISEI